MTSDTERTGRRHSGVFYGAYQLDAAAGSVEHGFCVASRAQGRRNRWLDALAVGLLFNASALAAATSTSAATSSATRAERGVAHRRMLTDDRSNVPHFDESGIPRRYWIKAVNVQWDYSSSDADPSQAGLNLLTGEPYGEDEDVFVASVPGQAIGSVYKKCVYREYSEDFGAEKERSEAEAHLGMLGPVIRAEVGDTIYVHFKNECDIPASVHPHGVFYAKRDEGIPLHHSTEDDGFDGICPSGAEHTYEWKVPEFSGPERNTESSTVWLYHSHVDEVGDTNGGLIGVIVITAKGKAKPDGSPSDVDQEIFSLFTVTDENVSPFLADNMRAHGIVDSEAGEGEAEEGGHAHGGAPTATGGPMPASAALDHEAFEESNLMHGINGFVYGHGPRISMCLSSKVRWYTLALGTEVDLHSPHWHGNTVVQGGYRKDVVSLLPGQALIADMTPFNPGTWMYHCHINDHISAGMSTLYTVRECDEY